MYLAGKSIVITGVGSGIGRALLHQLAVYENAQLFAVELHSDRLNKTIAEIQAPRAKIIPFACDVSAQASMDQLFEAAVAQMGAIDLFIANAGFAYYERIETADWEHMERIFRVNVFSPLYAAEKMHQLYGDKPYKVVILGSTMGHLAIPGYALYGATKAAIHRFADGYRFELDDPRKLAIVYPIATRTRFFESAPQVPVPFPSQTPEYVARQIIKGIEADKKAIYTSYAFGLLSLLERFLPFLRRVPQYGELRQFRRWLQAYRR